MFALAYPSVANFPIKWLLNSYPQPEKIDVAIAALHQYNKQRSLQGLDENPSQITISTQCLNADLVAISIEDNGPGIAEDVKKKLFAPFFTTKPVSEGTGLGLSISYKIIVEKHGGYLKCISEPRKGAEFWIEIPVKQIKD
jgi:two-component system, NtrC family, sensor kinase